MGAICSRYAPAYPAREGYDALGHGVLESLPRVSRQGRRCLQASMVRLARATPLQGRSYPASPGARQAERG
eukprot:6623648-Ditylum_brightwellii.AAC.1